MRMARRSKLTPEQIRASSFTTCSECGYKIQPSEVFYVDGEWCRCPQYGADFEPKTQSGGDSVLSPKRRAPKRPSTPTPSVDSVNKREETS